VNFRPIAPDDFPIATDIFYDSYNDLQRKRGFKGIDRTEDDSWLAEFLAHIVKTDPGSSLIAEDDAGTPVGFTSAYQRDSFWFLSFLFIMPGTQLAGSGRSLLQRVLPVESERSGMELATVIESIQPISTGLYARYGMTPRIPRFTVTGANPSKMPSLRPSLSPAPMTAEMIPFASEIDRELLGYARVADHAWWLSRYTGIAFTEPDGRLAGYAYVDAEGVGPVAASSEPDFAGILAHTISTQDHPAKLEMTVLSSFGDQFRNLLESGARMGPESYPFIYCSSEPNRPRSGYMTYSGYMP
jgi:hypothetical protein